MIEINKPIRSNHGDVPSFLSSSFPASVKITSGMAMEYPNSHAKLTADHDPSLVRDKFFFLASFIFSNKKNSNLQLFFLKPLVPIISQKAIYVNP